MDLERQDESDRTILPDAQHSSFGGLRWTLIWHREPRRWLAAASQMDVRKRRSGKCATS